MAIGLAARLALAAHFTSDRGDLNAQFDMSHRLLHSPLHAYATPKETFGNFGVSNYEWPYLPGYFPVLVIVRGLWHLIGHFRAVAAIPNILADIALAGLVAYEGRWRRWDIRRTLIAVALVAVGPVFLIVSGAISQIDSFAIVWAVVGVLIWSHETDHRAVAAGLLVGYAACVKPTPAFLILALLPSIRSRREGFRLFGAFLVPPVLLSLPFLIADHSDMVRSVSNYHGLPGFAGWSLIAQPSLDHFWLGISVEYASHGVRSLITVQPFIVLAALLAVAVLLWRWKVAPLAGASVIGLTMLFSNVDLSINYFVWALPFVILSGSLWAAFAIELVLAWPTMQLWLLAPRPPIAGSYLVFQILTLAVVGAAIVVGIVRNADRDRTSASLLPAG